MLVQAGTLSGLIRANALRHAKRIGFVDGDVSITHADLDRRTNRLANHLADMNVRKGDRVALVVLDGLPTIEVMIAAGKLGAITVPINWRLAPPEITHILSSSDPKCLFVSDCFHELTPRDGAYQEIRIADETTPTSTYWQLTEGGNDRFPITDTLAADALYMLHTSGTTGKPKGCLQPHQSAVIAGISFAMRRNLSCNDSFFSSLPLFHVGGLSHVFAMLACGGRTVFMQRGTDGAEMLRLALEQQCTLTSLNALYMREFRAAWSNKDKPALFFRSITAGAGMTPADFIRFLSADWNCHSVGGYGQTEVGGFATFLDGPEMIAHPTALGWPLPHLEMVLLDDNGRLAPSATEGEIGLRGPSVMHGYWRDKTASDAALGTGWLRTGDLARRDEAGHFHLLGRTKELIKSGGENVYPKEVEDALLSHPAIADAAIAGVEDKKWGEAVKAFIVLNSGCSLSPAEVAAWCREKIAGFKKPQYVEFLDSVPRDALGKIQRVELSRRTVRSDQSIIERE